MLKFSSHPQDTLQQTSVKTTTLDIRGMKCAGCVHSVERQLKQNPGVVSACVNLVTEVAVIEYDAGVVLPEVLAENLTSRGFPSTPRSLKVNDSHRAVLSRVEEKNQEKRQLTWRLVTATVLLLFSSLGHLHHLGNISFPVLNNIWFHWALASIAICFPGMPIVRDGWRSLRHGMPNMNTLVGLGTLSAYLASCLALLYPQLGWECFFDEPVMLLGFILLGRFLEGRARTRASQALTSLLAQQPQTARLIGIAQGNTGIKIPVEQVRLGELLQVLPGEKIPVDGQIVEGKTSVNESMLTGEAIPVSKQEGDQVAAGTLNQGGAIVMEATGIGEDTILSQIIATVEKAQTRKAPVQQLADRVAGYFAQIVMAIALVTFLFWYLWGTRIWTEVLIPVSHHSIHPISLTTSPLLLSLKLAIAVLVIACPCALGLATPTAILVGTSIGAERGILLKGGDILERVQQVQTIVFDKTGTLTSGAPQVSDYLALNSFDPETILQLAATIESGSNHPLATAILQAATDKALPLLPMADCQTEPGLGVSAQISDRKFFLGNADWMSLQGIDLDEVSQQQVALMAKNGKTVIYLAREGEIIGLIALEDRLRGDALKTVKYLQQSGLEVILLTGDSQVAGEAIAQQLGISQVFANIKPAAKAKIIQSLQEQGKIVAMVGDGINDAPALAQADLGISCAQATAVAIETADLVLMRGHLWDLVTSMQLSLATVKKIRQNLFWALGYNLIAIPTAAGLFLPHFQLLLSPSVAAAFMASSSVLVVTNSLLLRHNWRKSNFEATGS